jgi:hypothetical protein
VIAVESEWTVHLITDIVVVLVTAIAPPGEVAVRFRDSECVSWFGHRVDSSRLPKDDGAFWLDEPHVVA